jgi:two-component system chemotaxis response regulator CheY/two-component system response regulator (stage 0 sporulation protein A)
VNYTVKLFSELLQGHGIKVVGKGFNGQDAVFLYQKLKPDVTFLDVTMPVFNGVYALEKIRELSADAIVIMLADNITMNNEIAMNRLKPSVVIHEPIDINEIIRKTNELCAPTTDSEQHMKKTMVTLALKNTLLQLGVQELDKVVDILQKDYNCTLEDCYEYPQYLKQVLQDLFGNSYRDYILNSLTENMKDVMSQQSIKEFLQELSA